MKNNYSPLNENVLVKVPKKQEINKTISGILIAGTEHDLGYGEVLAVGPGCWRETQEHFIEKTEENKMVYNFVDVEVGDLVIFDKTFYHVYDIKDRNRVNNFVKIEEDVEYNYCLVKANDIRLKFDSYADVEETNMHGYLFSAMQPKKVKLQSQKGITW